MAVIYEPKGRAREYGTLAASLYQGCAHGCLYCYAPKVLRCDKGAFHGSPEPHQNVLEDLGREAANHAGEQVFFSFTTDPYQPLEEELGLTRQAIGVLNAFGVGVNILTKGGFRAVRDLHLLSRNPRNAFGVTLTTDDPVEAQYWEKGAALPHERIASLRMAKEMGIYTWVSFEPVINPMAVFRLISEVKDFVDMVKIGKLNYFPQAAQEVDWGQFHAGVTQYLASLQLKYYIKKDLAERAKHQGGSIERLREPDYCPPGQPNHERGRCSA